jgi:hypothetical protein
MLKFGFSKQKITPDMGVQLAGFLGERKAVSINIFLLHLILWLFSKSFRTKYRKAYKK